MLKNFILRNWGDQNHCTYISLEHCTFKLHSNTLYRIVYLNVVVNKVTVSNIIHAGTINSGSSTLLTFEKKSQVKGISFCREMPKSSWGIPLFYVFTSYSGRSTTRAICVKITWKGCEKKETCEINVDKNTSSPHQHFTCMWTFWHACEIL